MMSSGSRGLGGGSCQEREGLENLLFGVSLRYAKAEVARRSETRDGVEGPRRCNSDLDESLQEGGRCPMSPRSREELNQVSSQTPKRLASK